MLLVSALSFIIKCAVIVVVLIVTIAGVIGLIGALIDMIKGGGVKINRTTNEKFKELGTGEYYYKNYKSSEVIVGEEEEKE